MKKLFFSLALSVFCAIGAYANNPQADFLNLHKNLSGVSSTYGEKDFKLDGAPGSTPEQIQQAYDDAANFDWTVYPDPEPPKAAAAVQQDENIPIEIQVQLGAFAGVLGLYPYNPAGVQKYWADLTGAQPNVFTAPIKEAIEKDCLAGYVVLNPKNNPMNFHIPKPIKRVAK